MGLLDNLYVFRKFFESDVHIFCRFVWKKVTQLRGVVHFGNIDDEDNIEKTKNKRFFQKHYTCISRNTTSDYMNLLYM